MAGNWTRYNAGKINFLPREWTQKTIETAADIRKRCDESGSLSLIVNAGGSLPMVKKWVTLGDRPIEGISSTSNP